MASVPQLGRSVNTSNNTIAISTAVPLILIAVIVVGVYVTHWIWPTPAVSTTPGHPRTQVQRQGQLQRNGIADYVLESIPAVRYGGRMQLSESPKSVHPQREEAQPTANGWQPLAADATALAARADEHHEGRKTVKVSSSLEYHNEIPLHHTVAKDSNNSRSHHQQPSCSICIDDLSYGNDVRILPCGHVYHQSCIDPWLLDVAGTCP